MELLLFRLLLLVRPPRDGVDSIIVLPGLHTNNCASKVGEVVQRARHRAEYALDSLLTRHAGVHTDLGPSSCAAAQGINPAPRSWYANRASNVGADTNTATLGEKGAFSAGRAARGVLGDVRVATGTPKPIGRFEREEGDR